MGERIFLASGLTLTTARSAPALPTRLLVPSPDVDHPITRRWHRVDRLAVLISLARLLAQPALASGRLLAGLPRPLRHGIRQLESPKAPHHGLLLLKFSTPSAPRKSQPSHSRSQSRISFRQRGNRGARPASITRQTAHSISILTRCPESRESHLILRNWEEARQVLARSCCSDHILAQELHWR